MLLHPMDDGPEEGDDPLTAWEKRQEYRAVQWQWFLVTIYVVGLAMFVVWICTGE